MDTVRITYYFDFNTPKPQKYELTFVRDTMSLIADDSAPAPDWTHLEYKKCTHCPLNSDQYPSCPVAFNLAKLASHFGHERSYRETTVGVVTKERSYTKKASLQEGLHSIFGLIMATSGCPHMDFLKPMARFHLPFATPIETMVRSTSMYLLKQYFNASENKTADLNLKKLESLYAAVNTVNLGIIERIRSIAKGDADKNAIVILDSFASLLSMEISGDMAEVKKALEY